ncbi:MAG: hypothetical protein EOR35_31275 [Mesorhizobium sp.]|nr:MAG: hypothetical protein EOR35_31275 [Mesorhizobium sp.]
MQITNCGRGVHAREVKGIERLRTDLPNTWYAFTNLDIVLGAGKSREVDLIVVAEHRIFVIDIKDWHGRIDSRDNHWFQNDVDRGPSPVAKIADNSRDIWKLLGNHLKAHPTTKGEVVPSVQGLVVLTGKADRSGINVLEREKVLTIDEFVTLVANAKKQRETFGNVAPDIVSRPLTDNFWREQLRRFFNANPTAFRPGHRRFQTYVAGDTATFQHPQSIYCEYDAVDEGNPKNLGTLRLWDFTKCPDVRFQTEEGRREIAGREQEVYHWLRDRGDDIERILLTPKLEEPERSVRYWEVYDRRRRMLRLSDFAASEASALSPPDRIELARQLLAAVAALHRQDAQHLDLGGHSIWLESPTTVRLSHLLAARYPDVRSLGKNRFQFLSTKKLPEDVLGEDAGPKRRDVFLAGVAIHSLLFGKAPSGEPPEWKPEVDADNAFGALHDWFANALEIVPANRYDSAATALEAFNKATASRPTHDEVVTGLDRFRGTIRSQMQLAAAYPVETFLSQSDRVDAWRSIVGEKAICVKLWRQDAWGDLRREGAAVLDFLEKAAAVKADRPPGLPQIKDVLWLGDALVVAQEWVDGSTLAALKIEAPAWLREFPSAGAFMLRLLDTVETLHERGFAHGDLKPENIVITGENDPILIDALDFSPAADGDRTTSVYAPEIGSRFERDRFALTKIAEEIFQAVEIAPETAARITTAIRECREKQPVLATIGPLRAAIETGLDALSALEQPAGGTGPERIAISIVGAQPGPIERDEGFLHARIRRSTEKNIFALVLRGVREEVEFRLDRQGRIFNAWRRALDQRFVARNARHEFAQLALDLVVTPSSFNDLAEAELLLENPEIDARIREALAGSADQPRAMEEDASDGGLSEDQAEDAIAEDVERERSVPLAAPIDVPMLWRHLIDVENDLTTEGVAKTDSFFDRRENRHKVAIALEQGVFDFSRNDTVAVQRQDRRGQWRRVGELDLKLSRPELAVIDPSDVTGFHSRLIEEGQRLRFVSHFEVTSLRRRTDAVDRILAGQGRSQDLLSVFDARFEAKPALLEHVVDHEALSFYGLNRDQTEAFERLAKTRPVGILQGPPGTGKTRFIAALVHYAITKGLARNVLIASQSHEAVNTAAEAVLALFRKTGGSPSLLRVAMDEELLSQPLRPYYAARVEQAYKDRFRAAFKERIELAGRALGVPGPVLEDVALLELSIRPIVARITELAELVDRDEKRIGGLIETVKALLAPLELGENLSLEELEDPSTLLHDIAEQVLGRHLRAESVTPDRFERLRTVAGIGRDFVGSISRSQRSFETFLAGTRQIVAGTCVGLGRTSLGLTQTAFDLVIVDEAARCTASELLVPLQSARWAVLVGDQAQLEPHHEPEVIELVSQRTSIPKREIQRSDFERVFSTTYGSAASFSLKTQYRMLPPIGQLVSETFYPDLDLVAGRSEPVIDPAILPADLGHALTWIEADSLGASAFERKKENSSRINQAEADCIVALLDEWHTHEPFREWLLTQNEYPAGIGVICMYAEQRNLVERRLRQSALAHLLEGPIKVGTVDSYQGKENPIILLSLVRNNDQGIREDGIRKIQEGFLARPNRINVAASRAMDRLVVVGARTRWRSASPVGRLAAGFERQVANGKAGVISAEVLLEQARAQTGKRGTVDKRTEKLKGVSHGARR